VPPIFISERGDVVAEKVSHYFCQSSFQGNCTTAIVLSVQIEDFVESVIKYLHEVPSTKLREEIDVVKTDLAAESPWPARVLVDGRTGTIFVVIVDVWVLEDIEDPDSDVEMEDAARLINGGVSVSETMEDIWQGVVDGRGGPSMAIALVIGVTVGHEGRMVLIEGNETRGTAYSQTFQYTMTPYQQ
jgi:hypothetical protein